MNEISEKQSFPSLKLLDGLRVLICRPEPSAADLAQTLNSVGAECRTLPMLTIQPLDISAIERQHIIDLDQYQHVITVSQHAAQLALEEIDSYWPQFPVKQKWYAIGRKTSSILGSVPLDLIRPNHDLTSEALLQHPDLQDISQDKVLILKGKEGRSLLEDSLLNRAASVDTINLYERTRATYDADTINEAIKEFAPDFIVALSGETITNLIEHTQAHGIDLSKSSFILSSNRVANIAREQGISKCFVADNLMPMDIIKCIKQANKKHTA